MIVLNEGRVDAQRREGVAVIDLGEPSSCVAMTLGGDELNGCGHDG